MSQLLAWARRGSRIKPITIKSWTVSAFLKTPRFSTEKRCFKCLDFCSVSNDRNGSIGDIQSFVSNVRKGSIPAVWWPDPAGYEVSDSIR